MSLLDSFARLFVPRADMQMRSEFPSFEEQLAAIRNRQAQPAPWRRASVTEAMGVPAVFSAVSLISNTVGSMSLEAFHRGQVVAEQSDRPRLIVRPNPFTTPRVFFRDTAFHLATRGEAWWWIAARDIDDSPMSLVPVPPWEIVVEQNERNRLRPTIRWLDRVMRNEDMRQITYLPDPSGLRGIGPLQVCGAAVSVAVEAQQWAANFFAGSIPSIIGTTEQDMTAEELAAMDAQWNEKPTNLPRWLTNGLKMSEPPYHPEKAQLSQTRQDQVADVARMFDLPGSLLEFNMPGSSLRYQNDEMIWVDFQRRCLSPHYLEPIEQEISDLLHWSVVARFNTKQLLRAAIKNRFDVYKVGIEAGILTAEEARREEGLESGNVDFDPVPQSPPQAIPTALPFQRSMAEVRCPKCSKLVGRAAGPLETVCGRCGTKVQWAA